jgi:hypothetical protein
MGIAGCVLGAYMPYQHPVGISISVLWWGIYLGCLGASIGAGVGELFNRRLGHAPASPPAVRLNSPVPDDCGVETLVDGSGI